MFRRFALLCVAGAFACAPAPYVAPVLHRNAAERADSMAIAALAHTLTRNAATDSARAAQIYQWVARNVAYDIDGYYAGRLNDGTAEYVYHRRIAVCGGFVTLFDRMAQEVGLQTAPVLGYAKGFDYERGVATSKPNHSWTAVRIDGRWRLVDPTWGAGVVAARQFQPSFTWDYFLADPDAMILSHYPKDDDWQLLSRPVSRSDFERMPLVPHVLFHAGFTPTAIRNAALRSDVRDFPLIGVRDSRARVISAPIAGTLMRGSRVAVDILWPEAGDVALVSGQNWTHLRHVGDHFTGEAAASDKTFAVVGRQGANRQFETLLQYAVQ
jgi:hypothetical protein